MKLKNKEKCTSYSHLSQEPHPFCTKGCNSFRLSGGFGNQQKLLTSIVTDFGQKRYPASIQGQREKYGPGSNSPRVCAMAATFWENICKRSEGQRKWTENSVQFLRAVVIAFASWVGIRPPAVRPVELRRQ
ncbi:hypothetical protein AVEN_31828-1 [Araneus ventricosus]|uniref:Uncharacterized protein n=1 Tax=Araneus ventricosus TaxID=182803 RepID=A0A4Y2DS64_ARAVE|nr:hypothetical protein AVEN_6020-1 [Araneus ventricosus]GBM18994.1 hypothetical protein AVEN_227723-1 [Araneus ventricosus]GBM19001.1 hypothetical protein AVEN_269122-1 [Araneus ventricosus]GBM19005.1 hypothetical protein AVEN_31828-1 [Araneus ventricosus]